MPSYTCINTSAGDRLLNAYGAVGYTTPTPELDWQYPQRCRFQEPRRHIKSHSQAPSLER